jgi:two-component system chemotaxis sensor kinase CheA
VTIDEALLQVFVEETAPLAAEVETRLLALERGAAALESQWRALLGALHTIKGNCGMVDLDQAQDLAHAMEQRVREVRTAPFDHHGAAIGALLTDSDRLRDAIGVRPDAAAPTRPGAPAPTAPGEAAAPTDDAIAAPAAIAPVSHVRVPVHRLDRLLESAEELASYHERMAALARVQSRGRRARSRGLRSDGAPPAPADDGPPGPADESSLALIDRSRHRLLELRTAVTDLRLLPLSTVLARFERLVRDLCAATGKRAALEIRGGHVAVDKSVVDQIGEPLLHLIRNAIDHGVEAPRERARAGKPELATVAIAAEIQGGVLTVTVEDDGRGIDRGRLAAAASRRGIDVSRLDDAQVLDLVFTPELSTAAQVSALSGRGIGLDQARRTIERIGGSLVVTSERGQGTRFRLRVPAVIAVQRALLVACGDELYALPFTAVIEAFRLPRAARADRIAWRGGELPRVCLADELGAASGPGDPVTCVVVERGDQTLAVEVDGLAGQHDLLIKPLDPVFGRPRGVSGAAVLPDGRVVLVIDPHGIGRDARAATGHAA